MRRIWAIVLGAALLAGCAAAPFGAGRRESIARQIADDSIAFNEAYGQAVTGQILLNVLRSRDRLPRHYLSMTGISDSPSLSYSQSAGLGSVPFGDDISPWGFGNVGVERETETRPNYAVQPFGAETLTRTAFQPIAPYVFAHYWESGWPRDMLLLLMVERVSVTTRGQAGAMERVNEANNIADDCVAEVASSGCEFVRTIRNVLSHARDPALRFDAEADSVCGLVAAYGDHGVRPAPSPDVACTPVIVIGAERYHLHLRSLDDVVYYVGELLRAGSMIAAPGEAIEAQVTVGAAGLRGGGVGVPLFRVLPEDAAARGLYAASVEYGGARYFAGPAIYRSCADAAPEGVCRDDATNGDRTSSVLSLLADLLALNQSPEAIRAPSRLIAD